MMRSPFTVLVSLSWFQTSRVCHSSRIKQRHVRDTWGEDAWKPSAVSAAGTLKDGWNRKKVNRTLDQHPRHWLSSCSASSLRTLLRKSLLPAVWSENNSVSCHSVLPDGREGVGTEKKRPATFTKQFYRWHPCPNRFPHPPFKIKPQYYKHSLTPAASNRCFYFGGKNS